MQGINLSEVEKYVSETIKDLSGSPDKSYQTQGFYKRTLTVIRTINVLLGVLLVCLFVLAGGV